MFGFLTKTAIYLFGFLTKTAIYLFGKNKIRTFAIQKTLNICIIND